MAGSSTDPPELDRIDQVLDGSLAHVEGVIQLAGEPLLAPLSNRRCVAYEVRGQRQADGGQPLAHGVCDFIVEDETGRALVVADRCALELGSADQVGVLSVIDADLKHVELRLSDLKVQSRQAKPPQQRELDGEIRRSKQLATLLCAVRAHVKGNVHVGGSLAAQERYIQEQSAEFEGSVRHVPARFLERYDVVLEPGQRASVEGEASWEPDPDPAARGGGYRERPRRLVLRATNDRPLRVQAEGAMDARVLSTEMYLELSDAGETSQRGSLRAWVVLVMAVLLGVLGYYLLGCSPPADRPAETPTVVSVAAPESVAREPSPPLAEPEPTAAPPRRAASGGCPFDPPTGPADRCSGSRPAAPVLDHQAPAPRPAPAELVQAIEQLRDKRLRQRRHVSRALLQTELRNLERLLKVTNKTDPDRPALLERVADTQGALARAAARAGDGAAETKHRQGAVQHYRTLAKSYPTHQHGDRVLHHLALELERLADRSGARKAYLGLIQRWKKSDYVPQGYFAFAEMFFVDAQSDPAKWVIAEQSYQTVLKFPPPSNTLPGVASYRLGQVYAHQGQPTKALDAFVKALQHAGRFPQALETKALRTAALDAAAAAYAEVGRPDRACPFFHRVAAAPPTPASTLRALTTLGEAYLRYGHRDEAVTIYRLLERHHRGPEQCRDRAVLRALGVR